MVNNEDTEPLVLSPHIPSESCEASACFCSVSLRKDGYTIMHENPKGKPLAGIIRGRSDSSVREQVLDEAQ